MALIAQTDVFKGELLKLLGLSRDEILRYGSPSKSIEGDRAERLIWTEVFLDEAARQSLTVSLMVRLLDGRAWAVGMHSAENLFVVNVPERGVPHMEARPRPADVDPLLVNWVCRDPLGNYYNHGLGY